MKKLAILSLFLIALIILIPINQVSAGTYKIGSVKVDPTSNIVNAGDIVTFTVFVDRSPKSTSTSGNFDVTLTVKGLPIESVSFSPQTVYFASNDYRPKTSELRIDTNLLSSGKYDFTVTATRNEAPWDYKTSNLASVIINTPPKLGQISFTDNIAVGEQLTFNVNANDPDVPQYQSLTFSLVNAPTDATITKTDPNNALFSWTPTSIGSFTFNVEVSDGIAKALQQVTVHIPFNVKTGDNINVVLDQGVALTFTHVTRGLAESVTSQDVPFGYYPLLDIIGPYYQVTFAYGTFDSVVVAIPYDDTGLNNKQERGLHLYTSDGGELLSSYKTPIDFDKNGVVDVRDQTLLTNAINSGSQGHPYDSQFDVNGDGSLNQQDLEAFKPNLGLTSWIDITVGIDTINNIIYGSTGHFSGFGVR